MRILTVASELPPVTSGVAIAAHQIIQGARKSGHDVTTISSADGRTLRSDEFRVSTAAVWLTRSLVEQHDLVHIHGPAPSIADLALLRVTRFRPVVYTHHFTVRGSASFLGPAYSLYDHAVRRLARRATAVVTTTREYADHVRAAGCEQVEVIPWGVDPVVGAVPRDGSGPLRVLVLGQMRRYKGHTVAVDAVRDQHGIELTIAGAGPLRERLEADAASLSNVSVVLAPDDGQVRDLFRSHDVIALPALNESEAFGIVLVEGMAHGCIPVASGLRGVAEVASTTGHTFRPGDAASLRSTLLSLADDAGERHRRSVESIAHARTFTWERTASSYVELFERVVGAS